MSFVHLHCHSEYSLLDGANRIDDLLKRAKDHGMPALAITDHGNMHGAWEFQEKAKKAGIKPILGMEAYVAPGDRRIKAKGRPGDERASKSYYHLVVLAQNPTGYRNLVKLTSIGYTEGFYQKPRIDREVLAKYSEGIIVSSACLAGEVAQHLINNRYDQAREAAEWYANVFDGRYFLEVQGHDSEGQAGLNEQIFRLSKDLGLPVVATNDAHFLTEDAHDAHDVLMCIGLGKDKSDENRMHYDKGLYFKTADEMLERFPDTPEVLERTLEIAENCTTEFTKKYHVPAFPLPQGVASENDYLVKLATEGAKVRYGDPLPPEVEERLNYELGVIANSGYAGYFLITHDFIKAARDKGIPVGPGRGSAAGSLVSYALKITNLCPLKFDLLFERFLNPERVSMPDVDIDFCEERRGEVIEYVKEKYGRDSVGQIITFGRMKARAVIKDVGRTLGFSPGETDQLTKLIPSGPANALTVEEAIAQVPEVKALYEDENDDKYRRLLDYAMDLEGLSRHSGVHAAGVVIAPGPLDNYVPICTQPSKGAAGQAAGKGADDRVVVTQYDMTALEKAGMLKMDFLGLTTLTVINDTLNSIKARGLTPPDLDTLPLDDAETYRMLRSGRTAGVFQFESGLATDVLRQMRCDCFDDLVASNALLRPGPLDSGMHTVYIKRKRGEMDVAYPLPELEPILKPTFGVMAYQEQVMRLAQVLSGCSLGEADVLRKAVGKKDPVLIEQEIGNFVTKSIARGYDKKIINDLAGQIKTFGRYGFNKSHSAAYSLVAYHTAYLKAHFPADFMAALMSGTIGDTDKVIEYLNETREMGIEVLPPDVNESGYKFTVVGDKRIRFGLGAIRNVGHAAIDSIVAARITGDKFNSLFDFCERIDLRTCNKRALESLVYAGALDSTGGHRAQLLKALDSAVGEAQLKQEEAESGQESMFGDLLGTGTGGDKKGQVELPKVAPWKESERLQKEKEVIGFYVSGHPLESYRLVCEAFSTHTVSEVGKWTDSTIALAGMLTSIKEAVSKKSGQKYAKLMIEDFTGTGEIMAFPEKWAEVKATIKADTAYLLKCNYMKRDEGEEKATCVLDSFTPLADLSANGQLSVMINVKSDGSQPKEALSDVRAAAAAHPGNTPLEVIYTKDGRKLRLRSRTMRVDPTPALLAELKAALGEECVKIGKTKK